MRIAVQGVPGCFSEQAALQLRPQAQIAHCADFAGVFASLASGAADYGLLPIENTLAGTVQETASLLRQHTVRVEAEVRLQIELCLILHPAGALAQVAEVISHAVALRQCGRFLAQWPRWRVMPFFDTAGSVAEVMRRGGVGELNTAAIASAQAALVYGAHVAVRGIGDLQANYTRFFLVTTPPGTS